MSDTTIQDHPPLAPLPYHLELRDYLQEHESEVWNWFQSQRVQDDQIEAVRFELLKSTYRTDRETQTEWYDIADQAAKQLNLDVPITIYQAQNATEMNANIAYIPSEAHIVLSGPIGSKLSREEMLCVFAHELSHLILWRNWDGDFLTVDQVLSALTNDRKAHPAHLNSLRLFYLFNEIFCDRGSLLVGNDPLAVVSALVKTTSGLETVSAESYLKQANEIFEKGTGPSERITHPEIYIRARAIELSHRNDSDAEAKISDMIQGPLKLNKLDLLAQQVVSTKTRRLIDQLLTPQWMQSDTIVGHAKRFFDTYEPPARAVVDETLTTNLQSNDEQLLNYYCYVLLDFVTVDRDLEEAPLAAALILAEQVKMLPRFNEILRKELKLRKKQLERIDREKTKIVANAEKEFGAQP